FHYLPMYGILIAFKDIKIFRNLGSIMTGEWIGFKYFVEYLTDPYFWKLVRNTLLLNIYGLLWGFPIPIILAIMLNEVRHNRYKRVIQTLSYLPHFISNVVVCGMVVNFLSLDGIINQLLEFLGQDKIQFLMLPEWFRTIFTATGIWQSCGWNSIVYLAALMAVDQQLVEAAEIDGANRFQRIWHVSIPCITPTISIMLIMQLGRLMTLGYEKILLLYNGSTYETADVISTYVYRRGVVSADYSYSTAVGLFQTFVSLILLVASNKISKKLSETSLW
ncbi:MAG: sugar ABC transporter permease, partial [Lachnospiraceae bacterium]|nr:sugar ABC transporter permease [Lachnospiraceae bacterium]